jgi:HlyD family secretion protein
VQNVISYTVVISAENPDQSLLPGMTANVRVVVDSRDNALLVANAALRFRPAAGRLWIVGEDGKPAPVAVKTGLSDGARTEIVEGPLKEGDEVILGTGEPQAPKKPGGPGGPRMF